jgi:hypothetical protein
VIRGRPRPGALRFVKQISGQHSSDGVLHETPGETAKRRRPYDVQRDSSADDRDRNVRHRARSISGHGETLANERVQHAAQVFGPPQPELFRPALFSGFFVDAGRYERPKSLPVFPGPVWPG